MSKTKHQFSVLFVAMMAGVSQNMLAAPTQAAAQALNNASLDARFATVAKDVPGFGGLFVDENGDLSMYLTHPENAANAKKRLTEVFGVDQLRRKAPAEGRGVDKRKLPSGEIRVLQGRYPFDELDQWRKNANDLLNIDGVLFTDVDEAKNRINVGIVDANAKAAVEEMLASLGVPADAYAISQIEKPEQLATLSDYFGPVFGGLAISNSGKNCSLGFNAYWGGYKGFVTASHCSSSQGYTDYSYFHLRGTYAIGYEMHDPAYNGSFWPWDCPWGRRCRQSDSTFVYTSGWIGWNYARIARTTSWNGSTTINSTSPTFTIATEKSNVLMYQELDKVGAETGWTYGLVNGTCVDINVPGTDLTLKCQNRVSAIARAGDSGAPVFEWHPDGNVYLSGIVALGNGWDYWYSPISNIRNDLYLPGYGLRTYF